MAWVVRKGRRYYYRSRRVNGRVLKEYVGTGEAAELAAKLDAEAAARRELVRADRRRTLTELHELEALFDQIDREVNEHVSAVMTAAGFHRHRGEWRRTTVATPDPPRPEPHPPNDPPAPPIPPADLSPDELRLQLMPAEELFALARRGDEKAMAVIRPVFDEPGAADDLGGNVARKALRTAVRLMAGNDLVTREATNRKLEQLRAELAGPNPSPMEALLVDRVVAMWFQLHHLEREAALEGEDSVVRAGYFQRALTAAQNRYFAAIRELTKFRRQSVRAVQVNIAREQVNVLNAPRE